MSLSLGILADGDSPRFRALSEQFTFDVEADQAGVFALSGAGVDRVDVAVEPDAGKPRIRLEQVPQCQERDLGDE
ncbi:hypothetical protein [Micromonospora sp. NPDC005413]|uniref:hypothetical protein n=1 Tax=Micromonospora sp. NPDC005413 TaxID=3154563 RepID=UPI0033B4EFF7